MIPGKVTRHPLPYILIAFHVLCLLGVRVAWYLAIREYGAIAGPLGNTASTVAKRMTFSVYPVCEWLIVSLLQSTSSRLGDVLDWMGIFSFGGIWLWLLWPLLLILGSVQWFLVGVAIIWLRRRIPADWLARFMAYHDKRSLAKRLVGERIQPRRFLLIPASLPFLWFTLTLPEWNPLWQLFLVATLACIAHIRHPSLLGWLVLTLIYVNTMVLYLAFLLDDIQDLIAGRRTSYFESAARGVDFFGGLAFVSVIAVGLVLSKPRFPIGNYADEGPRLE